MERTVGSWTMYASTYTEGEATFLHCISVEIGSGIVNPEYRNVSEADTAADGITRCPIHNDGSLTVR